MFWWIVLALFLAPLVVGVFSGNGVAYLHMTIAAMFVWPIWFMMAVCAVIELRDFARKL